MANSKLEGTKETSEKEKEKLRQEYFPEEYKEPFKTPGIAGLVDIARMYAQRKKPPYTPYVDNNDEPEIFRDD